LMPAYRSDRLKEIFKRSSPSGKISILLSTWFYLGFLPLMPGTWGTLGALPLIVLLSRVGFWIRMPVLLGLIAAAVWASGDTERRVGEADPSAVVIDEVAGFSLALLFLPCSVFTLGTGFLLFRFFDIAKPYPVKQAERVKSGYGIVLDDLVAGLYTAVSVKCLLFLSHWTGL